MFNDLAKIEMSEIDLESCAERLRSACNEVGIDNPNELSRETRKTAFPVSATTARYNWTAKRLGEARNWIGYSIVVKKPLDWLLLGREPQHPDVVTFITAARAIIAKFGDQAEIAERKPGLKRIIDLLAECDPREDWPLVEERARTLAEKRKGSM